MKAYAPTALRIEPREIVALQDAQLAFAALVKHGQVRDPAAFYNEVRARGYALNRAMHDVLERGLSVAQVRELVRDARRAYQRSTFVQRVSTWPRGYRGDFETIASVMSMANAHDPATPEHYIEQFILDTGMSQQHRNKMAAQAGVLMWGLSRDPAAKVLSIAAGAAPEFTGFIRYLRRDAQTVVLNDGEAEGLERALEGFTGSSFAPHLIPGNVFRRIPQIERLGPYDCVVAGGLYDYLDARAASLLTRVVLSRLLRQGGRFFFTNVAENNPFRAWLDCIADWPLVERSRDVLTAMVTDAADDCFVSFERDATGLTEMVTVQRA